LLEAFPSPNWKESTPYRAIGEMAVSIGADYHDTRRASLNAQVQRYFPIQRLLRHCGKHWEPCLTAFPRHSLATLHPISEDEECSRVIELFSAFVEKLHQLVGEVIENRTADTAMQESYME
jgi:hypothetical protein